jgi:RNA polymerase sigma factor (sigma-70 family)
MDRSLVERAQRGDDVAFAAIVAGIGDQLMALAVRILRDADRAEDAVQYALVTAWRELPKLRDLDRCEAWMRRTLVNACYAEVRRDRRLDASVKALGVPGPGADHTLGVADRDAIERVFRRLPPDQRAVVIYRYYLGFALDDIATELSLPLGTVKSRLHYALAALRAGLDADARAGTPLERPA